MPHARTTDPQTSHDAAASVNQTENQRAVYRVLRAHGPATDVELVKAYRAALVRGEVPKQSDSGIRSRRSELVEKLGVVCDTGRRQKLESGRMANVWEVCNPKPPEQPKPPQDNAMAMALFDEGEESPASQPNLYDPD